MLAATAFTGRRVDVLARPRPVCGVTGVEKHSRIDQCPCCARSVGEFITTTKELDQRRCGALKGGAIAVWRRKH